MTKAKQYETVMLEEAIDNFPTGEKGAVVEVYTVPYEAYDIEIVTDDGKTKGLLESITPEKFELLNNSVRFEFIQIEDDGIQASVRFSDGTQVKVRAEELYVQST